MAAQQTVGSSTDDFHSLSAPAADDQDGESVSVAAAPPLHPVPAFQGAFEESIVESTESADEVDSDGDITAEVRRRRMLEAEGHGGVGSRWKHKPGAKHHAFVKLMAQIVYGIHLLMEGQARSNEEVVRILQSHVHEVDTFLERTSEDFDLAIQDIGERVRYLKLPMQHMNVFDVMLDEKTFRTELLLGNAKIEQIIDKTARAMNAAMFEIENGVRSTRELSTYLTRIAGRWPTNNADLAEVFAAMRGNEQGWDKYLRHLRAKGKNLRHTLTTLENDMRQISIHAAAASRRNQPQSSFVSRSTAHASASSSPLCSKFATSSTSHRKPGPWLDKPLPREPEAVAGESQAARSKPHPVPFATRYEQPRQAIPKPKPGNRTSAIDNTPRSHAATGPRDGPAKPRESMRGLADLLKNSGGLRSHPPDASRPGRLQARTPHRSQSQGGAREMTSVTTKEQFRRSRSQSALSTIQDTSQDASQQSVPKQPVRSSPGDRSDARYPPPSRSALEKEGSVSRSTGFSRRLSQGLKDLSPTTHHTLRRTSAARPVDSAHTSEKQRQSEEAAPDHEKEISPDVENDLPADPARMHSPPSTSGHRHSLFPEGTGLSTASQASLPETSPSPSRADNSWLSLPGDFPTSASARPTTHGLKASRTLSLRKLFSHRKDEGRNLMVS